MQIIHTKIRGRKAFAAEQKIREFKIILFRSKRLEKEKGKRLKPNDLIKKAAQNMNKTISIKYQLAPETIEKRSLNWNDVKYFQEIYDFMRLRKIETNQSRNDQYSEKIDRRKKKLRSPVNIDEKFLRKRTLLAIFTKLLLIIYPFKIEIGLLLFIREPS